MMTMDAQTITASLAKDVDGTFPDVVRLLQDGVYSGALRMLGNPHDAEEVAQEAFVRAYRALSGYEPERIRSLRLAPWVWTIAANLCRNRHRSRSRRPTAALVIEPEETGPGPEERAMNLDLGDRLTTALGDLPWPMRSAVVLRHVVGLSIDEISAAVGRPSGTVKSDIHRGLARLRSEPWEEAS
jgi:RNA polymerase sigma factor (sigma-70 family)